MATNLRRLGVYGDNLPVKRTRQVEASNFLIAGIMGRFERAYDRTFKVTGIDEFQEIFGNHVIPTYYGWDAVKGFFDNLRGVQGELYVGSYVGNDGTDIDAEIAERTIQDDGGTDALKISAGYKETYEYGDAGNRTAVQIENADRFSTKAAASVSSTGESSAKLDSVINIKEGDIVRFEASDGDVYHKITKVDESAKEIEWDGDFESTSGGGESLAEDDVVAVPGFRIRTFRKSRGGVETEVATDLGRLVCTLEPEVEDYYAPNVHSDNTWIVVEDLDSDSEDGDRMISEDSDPVYLEGGDDGTSPSGPDSWDRVLSNFDDDPVRMMANPETTDLEVQSAGEAYCNSRNDNPIWLFTIAEDQDKTQLEEIGNNLQRSDEVDGVVVANWLKVNDPFSSSSIAPSRHVPNVGHQAGLWLNSIARNGVHFSPAVKSNVLRGIKGVVGLQFKNDIERTELAEHGINVIQEISGVGTVVRNHFTLSTDVAYQFSHGILMRNYIKQSAVDSLQTSENKPNSLNRIKADKMALLQFLYRMWEVGSTGNVPTGETFGQTFGEEDGETAPEDHFEVTSDRVNNPQSAIQAGERNIDVYFTFPASAGSIKIGVGILLLG